MKNLLEFSTGQFMNIVFQINNKIQNIYLSTNSTNNSLIKLNLDSRHNIF